MGGILINPSSVFGEEAFLFGLFPSLPIIVYMEETECLLLGMVSEELDLHATFTVPVWLTAVWKLRL